jgi:thiamine-phosphate pyrophosphorylase
MSSNFMHALAGRRVYPITDRHLSGHTLAEQIAILSESGATLIQLREKFYSPAEFYNETEAAIRVARANGVVIIINDRVDIALAVNADGVHLGQDDLPAVAARHLLGPRAIIGLSTHNLQQAQLAAQMPVDYVAIGPIFATTTKSSSDAAVGLEDLSFVRQALPNIPLVAIGGITRENIDLVLHAGADAVAIVSDIWTPNHQTSQNIEQLMKYS